MKQKAPLRFRALEKIKVRPPSLVQICLKKVAQNFLTYDNLHLKLRKQMEDVYAMLDLNMPLAEAAVRISDENYWKRRTQCKHRNAQVEKHGMSWKQTFLELELQDALERLPIDHQPAELKQLRDQVYASKLHIFQLTIGQFPSHTELNFLFDALPALCTFSVTYGNRRLGMDYERAMFGMKISDAQYLARNVRVTQTLVSLALPCNMIDDELVKVLMGGFAYAHMLTHLDLSHNKIGDRGARRLASLLDTDYCIQHMDLSDNQIHANGCMHLGAHLAENMTCQTFNLRLNRCEDNGVSHLFQDLCVNKYLKSLNVSCNDLTTRCLPYLSSMISENVVLTEMDLSANPLYTPSETEDGRMDGAPGDTGYTQRSEHTDGGDGKLNDDALIAETESEEVLGTGPFAVFARCVMRSVGLLRVDIRQCGLPEGLASRINAVVKHRELRAKGIPVDAYEREGRRQKEEELKEEAGEEVDPEAVEGEEGAEGQVAEGEGGAEGEHADEGAEGEEAET